MEHIDVVVVPNHRRYPQVTPEQQRLEHWQSAGPAFVNVNNGAGLTWVSGARTGSGTVPRGKAERCRWRMESGGMLLAIYDARLSSTRDWSPIKNENDIIARDEAPIQEPRRLPHYK